MKEVIMGGSDRAGELDFWFDAFQTNCSHPEQLVKIFERGDYNATVHAINFPCHDALLFDLYPEAKVIHTERPAQSYGTILYPTPSANLQVIRGSHA